MKPALKLSFMAVMVFAVLSPCLAARYDCAGAIKELDRAIANRHYYYDMRVGQIDSIKRLLDFDNSSTDELLLNIERIGDEYSHFNNDSTNHYYTYGLNRAYESGRDSMFMVFNLKLAAILPMSGYISSARRHFELADTAGMTQDLKRLYFESGRRMHYFMSVLYEDNPDKYMSEVENIRECQRNMVELQTPGTLLYDRYLAEYYYMTQEYAKAWDMLVGVLEKLQPDTREYAITADMLSRIAERRGDAEAQKYYLAQASTADIYSLEREVASLQHLATLLFDEDDVYRANEYMLVALENATDCRSVARMNQITPRLPLITEANARLHSWWTRTYAIIITILCIFIVISIVVTMFLYRYIKKMRVLHAKLMETNRAKEVYMSQFMVLCSVYMDKLNQFNNLVNRKLSSGQTDDLYKMTRSGKLVEEQTREFYDIFDDAFLHIYPTFVEDVNRLLIPEEQIVLKEGERLNTDLRILACVRLGLEDANRIAQVLNYSVNTIYSYRNRLRNRAINRETFEVDLMGLGYL